VDRQSARILGPPDTEEYATMQWDRSRTVHPGWLAVEFGTCVGVWTVVTFLLARSVSGPGFVSAVVTGSVLAGVTWATVKLGWRETPRPPGTSRTDLAS
jgi:hypothetical protein